jgi:pectate lyase
MELSSRTKNLNYCKLICNSSFLLFLFLSFSISSNAVTRPTFSDTPFGFANVGGTFSIPACGSTPTYRVTTDAEYTAAKGSNRIIIFAKGNYSAISLSSYSNLSLIGEDSVDIAKISISGGSNILIRNISITRYSVDGLSVTGGKNIWIDHCTIGWLKTSPTRDSPDGAMDMTSSPDYITVSWCKFQNAWKFGLLGSSDSDLGVRHVTWFCNYIVNTFQRTPRIRSGETHIINCLYENNGWCRPNSMTNSEFSWQEAAGYLDDGEYLQDRRVVCIGYGIMAAYKANVIIENNFFYDVRWPICCSRPRAVFDTIYGDMQSPDIKNSTNTGCTAVKQFGNDYDDSGLLTTMRIKDANVSSASCGTMVVPLGYEYTYNGVTHWVIKPSMLNPSGRSIKFNDFNPTGVFDPTSYTGYYPTGFTAMTAQEVRTMVSQYAGANTIQFCATGAAPTLTTPTNKDQANADPLVNIVFTWGGGATDAKIFDLPAGLTVTKNMTAKTLTISGTPMTSSTYTVMTEGGTGSAVSVNGTITAKPAIVCASMLKISINGLATAGKYRLALFDATGTTEVKSLAQGQFKSGDSEFSFSASGLSSGTYTYKLISETLTVVKTGTMTIP